MITCRELVELLCDYVAGDLAPEHRARLEFHLSLCRPCVTYVRTYELTIQLTRRLPDAPLPPALEKKLRKLLAEVQKETKGDCGEA
jgi:anti-sigma factor RsiW